MVQVSLELGGKNASIIFDDADLEACLNTSVRASFLNQGEVSADASSLSEWVSSQWLIVLPEDMSCVLSNFCSQENLRCVLGALCPNGQVLQVWR